ncbi:MAG: hypothetical protein AB7U98_14930 [Candidatus Nitrosocosmicus sp.]
MLKYTFTYPTNKLKVVKGHAGNRIPSILDFNTINRRIYRPDVKIKNDDEEYIIIMIGS